MKREDKITVEITLAELATIYIVMGEVTGTGGNDLWNLACDTLDPNQVKRDSLIAGKTAQEIFNLHQYEDSVFSLIFSEKTETQLKLEELQRTIEDAQRQIEQLKEEI